MVSDLPGADRTLAIEAVVRRDRLIVGGGLAAVVILSAAYTVAGVGMPMSAIGMTRMADMPNMMAMSGPTDWSAGHALLVFLMWWIMMVAMMLPSAAPAVLTYAGAARRNRNEPQAEWKAFSFAAGYLAAWAAFSAVATSLQWGLQGFGLLDPMMRVPVPALAGGMLIAAGIYQVTPLKLACLRHCHHPLISFLANWRPGIGGAFRMGAQHGSYCLGCCWFLMALLFVGGIMNLLWIGALAIYVALEKFMTRSRFASVIGAVGMIGAGIWMMLAGGGWGPG